MLKYPNINPIAIDFGVIQVHWYGLTYLASFILAFYLGRLRAKNNADWENKQVDDLIFYIASGAIIGGRLGYALFYNLEQLLSEPLWLFKIWQGGMSFHGGLLGVLCSCWLWGRQNKKTFFTVTDFIAPLIPLGLGLGRIGNFINAELLGRQSDLPWAMLFPNDIAGVTRHPSQLYQALIEGPLLFIIIWHFSAKPRKPKATSGLFLLLYSLGRIFTEFFRTPDYHIGYIYNIFTMGQILSIPMLILGIYLLGLPNNARKNLKC